LVEFLTDFQHSFHLAVALFGLADDELLDFLKLMNSEKPVNVFSMSAGFFPEAGRVTCHFNRKLFGLEHLSSVIRS
jgi:hypothetical protein